jgi:hypothetical protein
MPVNFCYECVLCHKVYKKRGRLVLHLNWVHRKRAFSLTGKDCPAQELADQGKRLAIYYKE